MLLSCDGLSSPSVPSSLWEDLHYSWWVSCDTQSCWVVIIFVRVGGHSCWGSCDVLACINRWLWPRCKFKNKFQKFMLWTTSFQTEHVSAVHEKLLSSRIQGLFVFCLSSIWFPFSLLVVMWMFYGLLY